MTKRKYLCVPRALMTVDSSRPSLAVTWVTYCARRLSDSSTVFDRAALPVHSQSEPGRWQHSPVVMSGLSRGSGRGEQRERRGANSSHSSGQLGTMPVRTQHQQSSVSILHMLEAGEQLPVDPVGNLLNLLLTGE